MHVQYAVGIDFFIICPLNAKSRDILPNWLCVIMRAYGVLHVVLKMSSRSIWAQFFRFHYKKLFHENV